MAAQSWKSSLLSAAATKYLSLNTVQRRRGVLISQLGKFKSLSQHHDIMIDTMARSLTFVETLTLKNLRLVASTAGEKTHCEQGWGFSQ